jgi:pimeloyl-ACP methyl ester carboxylesterase
VSDHAADAAALLDHLDVARVHVAGHSSGAAVAAQLATDVPERVATLSLLELTLVSVPAGEGFLAGAAPVFEAYARGEHEHAVAMFLGAVSGLGWDACRSLLDAHVPGAVTNAVKDADTFFGVELPGLVGWHFGPSDAASIDCPVLSVVGEDTGPLWLDVAAFLRSHVHDVEERTIDAVGHLLHIQHAKPVADAIADFLTRHPIAPA